MKANSKLRNQSNTPKSIISKEETKHVAKLSNINITQKELKSYSVNLSEIVNYNVKHLKRINTKKIEPTAHAVGEKSVMRGDYTSPGLTVDDALKNASEEHNNLIKVKHIFGK